MIGHIDGFTMAVGWVLLFSPMITSYTPPLKGPIVSTTAALPCLVGICSCNCSVSEWPVAASQHNAVD